MLSMGTRGVTCDYIGRTQDTLDSCGYHFILHSVPHLKTTRYFPRLLFLITIQSIKWSTGCVLNDKKVLVLSLNSCFFFSVNITQSQRCFIKHSHNLVLICNFINTGEKKKKESKVACFRKEMELYHLKTKQKQNKTLLRFTTITICKKSPCCLFITPLFELSSKVEM